ncbi:caspase family protein [Mycolicibacterium gilvum]|uniref:caspase family protein n=1 Tax=Mycolicibacterium gilvum TaxID=1804 RepID=UPI0040452F88
MRTSWDHRQPRIGESATNHVGLSNDCAVDPAVEALFIGVGIDHYTDLPELVGSADEVQAIAELVGDHFNPRVLRDADEATIATTLRDYAGHFSQDAGGVVLMWSGHGIPGSGSTSVRLLAGDSLNDPSGGIDAVEVATKVAATGANQILFIVDTCYAGNAVDAVVRLYNHFRHNPPGGEWCWFGLLAACGPEKVRQHVLGPALERLLRDGPRVDGPHADDLRRRWSTHHRLIRGDDLWDALIKQWDRAAAPTEPKFTQTGDARPFIRNPLWSPAEGPLSVAEVLTGTPAQSLFFGRHEEVATVSSWQAQQQRGVYVITGAAGSGKSALLHHALSLNTRVDTAATDTSPAVIVDVAGLSTEVIAETIDRVLVARGLLGEPALPRNAFEICGALQRRRDTGAPVPVIALDAISEAAEPTHAIESLVTPLSTVATVIVTTRPTEVSVARQRRASQPPQWAAAGETADLVAIAAILAAPDQILDLDSAQHQASGWNAIDEMLDDQLGPVAPDHDPAAAIRALRHGPSGHGPPPFVLANLMTDYMREPAMNADPTRADTLGAALDQLVFRVYDESTLRAVVDLLNVLPYGLGAGLPELEWLTIANATRAPDTHELDRPDVAAALAPMGAYIVEDSESGEAVYRFAHTLIAQHFADRAAARVENTALPIAAALVNSPRTPHLARYLWRYVAHAGRPGLDLLREKPSLSKDLAAATLVVSITDTERGDINAALSLAEDAASRADQLTGIDREQLVAPALAHLATLYKSTGQITRAVQTGRRAVAAYNQLVSQRPELVIDLAAAAHNLAGVLMDAQDVTAATVAAQAVELEEQFAQMGGDNRYRLGVARNTLALALSMQGRISEAVQASRDAVDALQGAANATGTEPVRAALAQALQNLGSHLADRGDVADALTVTEQARAIMDELVAIDDTWRPALLETLSDLGARYSQDGQGDRALATTAEAIAGYRSMSQPSAAEMVNYAGALTNYANILVGSGRAEAAIDPARAAVEMMRDVADREPSKRPAFALMLENYANTLTLTGHHSEGLEASEQALQYFRAARENNPGLDADIGRVLSNYCQRLAAVGRFPEAVAAGYEAISIYERLSTADPQNAVHVATIGSFVAIYTVHAGNASAGMLLANQATRQGEQLLAQQLMSHIELATIYIHAAKAAETDPAQAVRYAQRVLEILHEAGLSRTPEYATALRNLAALHGMAGRIELGLAAIDEAVALWTQLLDIDRSHRHGLASAMGTQARLQLENRQPETARDTAIAAVELYRLIPELSVDDVDTCGKTAATLAIALDQLGHDLDQLDQLVAQCLETLDPPTRALLLYTVVSGLPLGHERAPSWIKAAIDELGNANPMLLLHLRRLTRRIRAAGRVRFDLLWRRATDTDVPNWAAIEELKIEWALRWVSAPDYTTAQAFLQQNRHLLGADYDSAVDEAFLVVDPTRAAALRDIRDQLRFNPFHSPETLDRDVDAQIDAAYRKNIAEQNIYDLAERFLEADLHQRISLLSMRGEDLRGDTAGRHLRARADSPRAASAVSLIELSRIPLHTDVAAAAADAEHTESLLAQIAEHYDVKVLRRAAVVLMHNATETANSELTLPISFYLGVTLLAPDIEPSLAAQARGLIASAAEAAPTRVPDWLRLCERLSQAEPEFRQAAQILQQPGGQGG